jgi:UDP-4-amino-4-deoxy-L-arabinose formyltransferase/UDP-glucuronic acid dehydrogenase (UDP-4-keto-hexauronic acid decarboxylating)
VNVFVLSTVGAGLDTISLLGPQLPLAGVIGLIPRATAHEISGYVDHESYCLAHDLKWVGVRSYDLTDVSDRSALLGLDIDLLLVLGWQRLIPEWLLSHCTIGAIGVHGSARGITRGRGRSPQNWALLLGHRKFELALFWVETSIDSGPLIDRRAYEITDLDDIASLYLKACWLTAEMLRAAAQNASGFSRKTAMSQADAPRYLPRRLPEDGQIDWRRSTSEIYDFVRALTRPYPGAWTTTAADGARLRIWRARPFDLNASSERRSPGRVIGPFSSGSIVVETGDGYLLVDEWDWDTAGEGDLGGAVFASVPFKEQIRRIVKRHHERYPHLPLSEDVTRLAAD